MKNFIRYLKKHIRGVKNLTAIPPPGKPIRIVYQPYTFNGACGIIDEGFVNGLLDIDSQVIVWDCVNDSPHLDDIFAIFHPTHFIGYMQNPRRSHFPWLIGDLWQKMLCFKEKIGLKVAVNSFPSNIRDLYGDWLANTERHREKGVYSYYNQQPRPTAIERDIINSGFIDLILARDCIENIDILFKNFLDLNISILVQPPAFDQRKYVINNEIAQKDKDIDLLFIGNSWSFKWENMKSYVLPLKEKYGDKFVIYGNGWPGGLSRGALDDSQFADHSSRAKINFGFHEPSQVMTIGTGTNERVFKLLGLSTFVVSDPCTANKSYFIDGEDLIFARSPEEILAKTEYFLERPDQREIIGKTGNKHILEEHTYGQRANRLIALLDDFEPGRIYDYI